MVQELLRQKLKDISFSASLPEHVLRQIAAASKITDFPAGAVMFREGDENHNLYLICSGSVALEMSAPDLGCVRVLTLGAGDMVAWSAMLGRGEMSTTAVIDEDTQAISISAPHLLEICEEHQEVGFQIMRRMAQSLCRRLVATRLQLLDLFSDETAAVNKR